MNAFVTGLVSTALVQRIGWALIHFLWQGIAVALVLALALQILRRRSAQARWAVSCAALGLMAVLPVITTCVAPAGVPVLSAHIELVPADTTPAALVTEIPASAVLPPDAIGREDSVVPPTAPAASLRDRTSGVAYGAPLSARIGNLARPLLPWAFLGWLVGVIGMSLWHLGGWLHLRRISTRGAVAARDVLSDVFDRAVRRLQIARCVRLLESTRVAMPMAVGWLRPVVLLPVSAATGLTPGQLEAVLAHELAHIRRHDYLIRLVQAVVETLLFYHPAVWWVSGRIRQESEHCCDELAVEICGDRHGYARALAKVAELGSRKPHLATGASGGSLLGRIRRIVGLPDCHTAGRAGWLAATLILAAVVAAGFVVYGLGAAEAATVSTPPEVQRQIERLSSEDPNERYRALLTLRSLGGAVALHAPGQAEKIVAVLKNKSEAKNTRAEAARVLGFYEDKVATDALESVLADDKEEPGVRSAASGSLSRQLYMVALRELIGPRAGDAELLEMEKGATMLAAALLKHEDPSIRSAAHVAWEIANEEHSLHPLVRAFGGTPDRDPHPWGQASEGVQCRVRVHKGRGLGKGATLWTIEDLPVLRLDIRNNGPRDLQFLEGPEYIEFGVGDLRYRYPITLGDIGIHPLPAGEQRNGIRLPLYRRLRDTDPPMPVRPGRHDVRVTIDIHPQNQDARKTFKVTSNPIDITLLPPEEPRQYGEHTLHAGFVPDRPEVVFGEELGVTFYIKNVGEKRFHMNPAGDRAGPHGSFGISAVDSHGNKVLDPDPGWMGSGGVISIVEIDPGKGYIERLSLYTWCRFFDPGVYTVTCAQGSFKSEFKLTLKAPAPKDPRSTADEMMRRAEAEDLRMLAHPVYLPYLVQYARDGNAQALSVIGSIATPQATKSLIDLAQQSLDDGNTDLALSALQRVSLPDPSDDVRLRLSGSTALRDELAARSWRPEHAGPLRRIAARLAHSNDVSSLKMAARVFRLIGTAEDVADLAVGFTNAIEATKTLPPETGRYPAWRRARGACGAYRDAAGQMIERGMEVPDEPESRGEAALYFIAMQMDEQFRPPDWRERAMWWLRHETPYMREFVLEHMPEPFPEAALEMLPEFLLDDYGELQRRACYVARVHPRTAFREPLVTILRTETDPLLLGAAADAGPPNGVTNDKIAEIRISRTGEADFGRQALKGADVNVKSDTGRTPLHSAALEGHKDVAELLLASGADVNARDEDDSTPLHSAALEGHKDVAELLLANGADVNAKNDEAQTPLAIAEEHGHTELVELLKRHGAAE